MSRIVIWSGGYDSTLALWRELEDKKEAKAISFIVPGISSQKMYSEEACRERFKKKVSEKGWKLDHTVVNLNYDWQRVYPTGSYVQQYFWLAMGLYFCGKDDTIIMGYVRHDDYWLEGSKFEAAIKVMSAVLDKKIEFEYPLKYYMKYEVYRDICRADLDDCVFTCESPLVAMVPCGKCESCIKIELAKKELEIRGQTIAPESEEVKKVEIKAEPEVTSTNCIKEKEVSAKCKDCGNDAVGLIEKDGGWLCVVCFHKSQANELHVKERV